MGERYRQHGGPNYRLTYNFSSGIWTQGDLSIIKDATYGFNQKEDVVATLHPLHWTTSVHLQNTTVALILTVLTVRR